MRQGVGVAPTDILSRYHGHGAVGFQNHLVGIGIRRNPGGAQGRLYLFFRNTRSRHRIARILTLVSEKGRFRLHYISDISTLQNKLCRDELAGRENHNCRYHIDTCDIAQQNPACR